MILLLDGYNILKQVEQTAQLSEKKRDSFVRLLGKYSEKKHHKIIIYFDGGTEEKPYHSKMNGVIVWFSGYHKTADDLIIAHAPQYKNKDTAVVTSDREIIDLTKPYCKTVFDPHFFYKQVQETFQTTSTSSEVGTLIKLSTDSSPELDTLMQAAARIFMPPKDESEKMRLKKETRSKKERALHNHKKKL